MDGLVVAMDIDEDDGGEVVDVGDQDESMFMLVPDVMQAWIKRVVSNIRFNVSRLILNIANGVVVTCEGAKYSPCDGLWEPLFCVFGGF